MLARFEVTLDGVQRPVPAHSSRLPPLTVICVVEPPDLTVPGADRVAGRAPDATARIADRAAGSARGPIGTGRRPSEESGSAGHGPVRGRGGGGSPGRASSGRPYLNRGCRG